MSHGIDTPDHVCLNVLSIKEPPPPPPPHTHTHTHIRTTHTHSHTQHIPHTHTTHTVGPIRNLYRRQCSPQFRTHLKIWIHTWIFGAEMKAFFGKTRVSLKPVALNSCMVLLRRCAQGTWGFCIIGAWQTVHITVSLDAIVDPNNPKSNIRRKYHQIMLVRSECPTIVSCQKNCSSTVK